MNENEAMAAMGRGAKVIFRTIGKIYRGRLIARIGSEFIFEGSNGKERIRVRGKAQLFSLEEGE